MKKWKCDYCGEEIQSVEDGCLEWMTEVETGKIMKPRIVHRIECLYNEDDLRKKYNSILSDLDLVYCIGDNGLMQLLELVSEAETEDKEDFINIIKRLHISNYEESFRYFEEAIQYGVFEPNTKPNYYTQNNMKQVINWKNNNKID